MYGRASQLMPRFLRRRAHRWACFRDVHFFTRR